ncbi:MAG: MinD/ParA family protein [Proteobacteria bacterium]|nr:MinD/ParA family protein [Pseudomonadota bacterium]
MNKIKEPTRVITITSGKGGVGKTHTTVNLGLALAKLGKKVLLLDGDLGLANINILMGFKPKKTLHQVVTGEASLQEVIVSTKQGIDIIPASCGIPELTNLSEEDRISLINAFDTLAEEYDYMLIDTAAGIGDNVLYFNIAAEDIIVVVGPEPTSITDAYALIKVLSQKCDRKEFNILINRCTPGSDGRNTFAQFSSICEHFLNVSLKFLGSIVDDESVSQAVLKQRPFLELYPSSRASQDVEKLARKLTIQQNRKAPQGGLQFFFKNLLDSTNAFFADV